MGSSIMAIWVIWLLIDGVVAGAIAVRQFQLWRGAEHGERLPVLLVFLLMVGWSIGGFIWIVALGSLAGTQLPRQYTVLMLVARTCGSIPIWLWLGMLVRGLREGQLRAVAIWVLGWFTRIKLFNRWRESLLATEEEVNQHAVASGDLMPDFWRREFREAVREELEIYFGHKPNS